MDSEQLRSIPEPSLRRLPRYHRLMSVWLNEGKEWVSCSELGTALNVDPTQVRKDVAYTNVPGRRKVGYPMKELMEGIEEFLGWNNARQAFLAGAGHLGTALLNYQRFSDHGLEIVAAFDTDEAKVGKSLNGKEVLPLDKMSSLARRMHILVGVIAVPAEAAQQVADMMVAGGIQAIWNFAPTKLEVPTWVIVQDEDLFSSLAVLSRRLMSRLALQEERSAVL